MLPIALPAYPRFYRLPIHSVVPPPAAVPAPCDGRFHRVHGAPLKARLPACTAHRAVPAGHLLRANLAAPPRGGKCSGPTSRRREATSKRSTPLPGAIASASAVRPRQGQTARPSASRQHRLAEPPVATVKNRAGTWVAAVGKGTLPLPTGRQSSGAGKRTDGGCRAATVPWWRSGERGRAAVRGRGRSAAAAPPAIAQTGAAFHDARQQFGPRCGTHRAANCSHFVANVSRGDSFAGSRR